MTVDETTGRSLASMYPIVDQDLIDWVMYGDQL